MPVSIARANQAFTYLTVTIRTGITEYRPGDDKDGMLVWADGAFYRAKVVGSHRCDVQHARWQKQWGRMRLAQPVGGNADRL